MEETGRDEGFFEEDERMEDVVAAFATGELGVTAPAFQFSFVTDSLNTGITARAPFVANWLTANPEATGQNTGPALPIAV
jgi:hypothetical protein